MEKTLHKDSHGRGVFIGLLLPLISYIVLYALAYLLNMFLQTDVLQYKSFLKLLGIALNFFPLRYYFVKLKFELTGRGILLVTFIYIIVYFWLL